MPYNLEDNNCKLLSWLYFLYQEDTDNKFVTHPRYVVEYRQKWALSPAQPWNYFVLCAMDGDGMINTTIPVSSSTPKQFTTVNLHICNPTDLMSLGGC